ncbi:MAG: class I SAM-dependent methyltransferase [Caldilinea sp. CFX5]|nr:class I SAM-dependent methyltransferase [Caldilinea sp. CFX5]
MDRKTYMKDVYSTYWLTARDEIYGFLPYDRNLCALICERVAKDAALLEVAIGTGYPIADFLQKSGHAVYGVDIAFKLVQKCRAVNAEIATVVGDAEALSYTDNYFPCVYCLHASWYIPNLNQAINEMLRVTHAGGIVIFDIQNRNHSAVAAEYQQALAANSFWGISLRIMIGFRKHLRNGEYRPAWQLIKGFLISIVRHKTWIWHVIIHQVPTYPEAIYQHLQKQHVSQVELLVECADSTLAQHKELNAATAFSRLIFVVTK